MPEQSVTYAEVDGQRLRLTNLDKIMYPATETTKGEVLNYYARIAPRLLEQLADRPVTRVRFPHGVADLQFFEKNAPGGMPSWIRTVLVGDVNYPVIESAAALMYFANLGSLEFHTPQWRVNADGVARTPDRIVLDLDPGAPAGLDECARVALIARELFSSLGWQSVPVTSGSKGLQVYAALDGERTSDEVRELARVMAEKLVELEPNLVVAKMAKSIRAGKVFIDWSQNIAAKTTITPWSMRGRNVPRVAAPRRWEEIERVSAAPGALVHLDIDEILDVTDGRILAADPMNALTKDK